MDWLEYTTLFFFLCCSRRRFKKKIAGLPGVPDLSTTKYTVAIMTQPTALHITVIISFDSQKMVQTVFLI